MKLKMKIIILISICLSALLGAIVVHEIMSKSYLNEIEYDELINKFDNKESFILLVSQTTCGHCATYKPKLEEVANKYEINIYYIDVDLLEEDNYNKLKTYISFSSTPVTFFIKNGEETTAATRINGDASKEKIEKKLKSNGFIN